MIPINSAFYRWQRYAPNKTWYRSFENFKLNSSSNFLTLSLLGGGIKNGVIVKIFGELELQNTIFTVHKNKFKSKSWDLYLQNWASYMSFREATWGENLYQARISNFKISVSFWDLGPIFWDSYIGPTSNPQNLDPLTGRVKQGQNSASFERKPNSIFLIFSFGSN